jgi:hypothetical protein
MSCNSVGRPAQLKVRSSREVILIVPIVGVEVLEDVVIMVCSSGDVIVMVSVVGVEVSYESIVMLSVLVWNFVRISGV